MINEYQLNSPEAEAAIASTEPKQVWVDGLVVRIYTGDDISPAPETPRTIPAHEFRDRFSDEELDAVMALAYSGDTVARRLLLKVQTAQDGINLDSPEVVGGLDYLVSKYAIAATRPAQIRA